MGLPQGALQAGTVASDRISNLGDGVLGHILSFLPTKEAGRIAVLSSRWRDVFESVHSIALTEQEGPIPDYVGGSCYIPNPPPPPFIRSVTAALFARSRHPAPATATPPLRAIRVEMLKYDGQDSTIVDQWVSYALKHAACDLEVDLHLRRVPACTPTSTDRLLRYGAAISPEDHDVNGEQDDEEDVIADDDVSSADERTLYSWELPPPEYAVPRRLLCCDALRLLRIGPCRLCLPAVVSLPSLQTLHLIHVSNTEKDVQRLISACPRLEDLTLEACDTVTELSLLVVTNLGRLSILCCHKLTNVAVDMSRLHSFEYRGIVPDSSIMTNIHGSSHSFSSCKVDICAADECSSREDLLKLRQFLQRFPSMKHLRLRLGCLGFGFLTLPELSSLHHLELRGRVLHNDHAVVDMMSRILQQVPKLEVLSLIFETAPQEDDSRLDDLKEGALIDAHHLNYNRYNVLDVPSVRIPCLSNRVRRISLVHYQGGKAQRALAKFLLCNAPVLDKLYCGFARGPLWIQEKLIAEIQDWAMNKPKDRTFT